MRVFPCAASPGWIHAVGLNQHFNTSLKSVNKIFYLCFVMDVVMLSADANFKILKPGCQGPGEHSPPHKGFRKQDFTGTFFCQFDFIQNST